MKGKMKRMLSGVLTAVTLFSSVIGPATAYAAEPDRAVPPSIEEIRDMLDEDEIVTANDYEMNVGYAFDLKTDFSGIEIPDNKKVSVSFEEAQDEQGNDFTSEKEGVYTAVYYVEPLTTDHPTYQINRKLIVKETSGETETSQVSGSDAGDEDSGGEESEEGEAETVLSETEFDKAIEEMESQDTYDEGTGLSLGEVWNQVIEGDVDLLSMKEEETITFMAYSSALARSTSVNVTRGNWYYYADYGLGTYVTSPFTVKFGDVTATAYCVQPSKPSPGDGVYEITKLSDGKALAKVCYYGTNASKEDGFFDQKHPDFSAGKRFIITHLAASYANGSSDAFYGTNETGKALAMELYNFCINEPDIPDVHMSFSEDSVTAYVDGNSQRTKSVAFRADEQQTITMNLPKGVKLHNETTGKTSAAGASVTISGGTTFYLSAPLTQAVDVKQSWSSRMKGSIDKDYSAYKITTGATTQDLALVFGEGVSNEKYVSFSVTWVDLATVSITKKDAATGDQLSGAVYGIYSDAACTKLIVQMPATDAAGYSTVTFAKTQETVYLKEITAPTGFVIDTQAKNVTLVSFQDVGNTVTDKKQLGQLTVFKEGEVLTGADVTEEGVRFQYSTQKLSGAKFNVYAAEDIKNPTGNLIHKRGALVAENLTTDNSGCAILKDLHLGSYTIVEMAAPSDFVNHNESKTVTLTYAGQQVETVFTELTFQNERQKVTVDVVKQDRDTRNPLPGGIYGLYANNDICDVNGNVIVAKGTLIEKVTTGVDGKAAYQADLPINNSYYVQELQAPDQYVRTQNDIYTFHADYAGEKEAQIHFNHTFLNKRVNAKISLIKKDAETGVAQGDATLEGAMYGLYAREDIVHPDGKTGVIYPAGTKITELVTNKDGNAKVENLYLGKYFVKELKASEGYLLDATEYDLDCSYEGDLVETVKREAVSLETVIKQPFQIIKAANNGKTDADLLKGAGFTAYLVSSLQVKEDGSYDFDNASPVIIGENGATEIFTDEKGHAVSIPLPYGTYVVRETTTPHNYKPVDDFIVKITENHPNEPQIWRVLLDEEFKAKLKIIKKDDETKQSVLLPGTEFKVYDLTNKKYVEQVTTYPTTVVHKSYFTDEEGYLILPENLKIGKYRIEEVTAPDGYTVNKDYVEIAVDSNTAYHTNSVSGDLIIEVDYENHPVKGQLTIEKSGEVLVSYDGGFHYKEAALSDAVFEVYAAEDIYTPDHQKDEAGNRILIYAKGSLVATATTDETGKAVIENLPLGTYTVKEKTAPTGFVLNTVPQDVTFAYAGQDTPVVEESVAFTNDRQKVELSVIKKDVENGSMLSGAVFGLYNQADLVSGGNVIVEADTLLQKVTSGEDGKAVFTLDLPLGKYYVRELKAPAGYVSSDEVLIFDAAYQGQDIPTVVLESEKKNEPTTFEFTKSDITTGVELSGATLTVLDTEGSVVDTWTSVKDEPHVIKRLTVGETYTLREEFAPFGYLKATDVTFMVEDTAEVQKVEMKDEVPTALLIVNKKGEFLDKITLLDKVGGFFSHLFEYVTGNLSEVTFEVYAAEDIKAADGVSEDYFKADDLIGTITTDENGIAKMEGLPAGKYYVKEAETAHGFVLDDEPRYVDLSYRDQDTPVITYEEAWQNNRQKVSVHVSKKEKDTERFLEGCVIALFTREDIVSAKGELLMKADTMIEVKATDAEGKAEFIADLPVDGKYYVKEIAAPDGFTNTGEEFDFTFDYAGQEQAEVGFEFLFENEPTTVEFSKKSLTTGEELPGAHLQLTDSEGAIVEEWVSTEEPHIIKELVVGEEYTLTEIIPATGYVTAESITFVVEDTAEIQKVEMKDDVTKVEISKTDITTGEELPGAELTILDENGKEVEKWTSTDEPHYIEMLPIGKYTLHEEKAPDGYVTAEDVPFEVLDTAEIQKVEMKDDVTKVEISKTDITTGKELPGAELTILDENGKEVEKWTSTDKPHYIEKLPVGKYTLREVSAPDGYLVAEDVSFEVTDDAKIHKVEMKDEPKPAEETPNTPDTPKTGDDRNIAIWLVLCLFGAGGIAGSAWYLRRRRK